MNQDLLREYLEKGFDPIIRHRMKPSTRAKKRKSEGSHLPSIEDLLGRSRASIWRDVVDGRLEPPIRLGENAIGWKLSTLMAARKRMEDGIYC